MSLLLLLSLLFAVAFVMANHLDDDDDSTTSSSTSFVEGRDKMKRPWKIYTESTTDGGAGLSTSDSTYQHLKNEPYFRARHNGRRIKKWFKHNANMTKAYCYGDDENQEACEYIMCEATKELDSGELADHIDLDGCRNKDDFPNDCEEDDDDDEPTPECAYYKEISPSKTKFYLQNVASQAKKLCHKTKHLTDDHCKNKVECLTLEALTAAWPQLFKLKNCKKSDLAEYPQKQDKTPQARAARKLEKEEDD